MLERKVIKSKYNIREAKNRDELQKLAALFCSEVTKNKSYISSGEIKYGLSDDGKEWNNNLYDLILPDFLNSLSDNASHYTVFGAWLNNDKPIAVALTQKIAVGENMHHVIDDIIIMKKHRRSGIGSDIIKYIESYIQKNTNSEWIFLEIGAKNKISKRFFTENDYNKMSEIFGKKIN